MSDNILQLDYSTFLRKIEHQMPVIEDWDNANHELSIADEIIQRCRTKGGETNYGEIILLALKILANISLRDGAAKDPYGAISLPDDYLWYYPVNLNSFFYH